MCGHLEMEMTLSESTSEPVGQKTMMPFLKVWNGC
jgi:hypothetical protein